MHKLPPVESLDLSSKRSIDIQSLDDKVAVLHHFYHDGRYWVAALPLDGVESICGQAFNFSAVKKHKPRADSAAIAPEVIRDEKGIPIPKFGFINHCQSRFRMKPDCPVKLFDIDAESVPDDLSSMEPSVALHDFIYSIEATGVAGAPFDFWNGMKGTLVCAHRFLSTQEMVFERAVVQNYYVRESPPIPLSDEQMRQILIRSIQRADQADLKEAYFLYRPCRTNNCTSNPFQIIDSCVQYTWGQWLGSLIYRLPLNPRLYLRIRGLDSDPNYFHLVRTEFSDFIQAESTRKRKREVVRAEIKKRRKQQDREPAATG